MAEPTGAETRAGDQPDYPRPGCWELLFVLAGVAISAILYGC